MLIKIQQIKNLTTKETEELEINTDFIVSLRKGTFYTEIKLYGETNVIYAMGKPEDFLPKTRKILNG